VGALPLINTLGMKVGSEKAFGAGYNVLPVWKKRLDAKTLVTTPNSDVIYAMSYLDVGKDGPMVLEAAPGLQGILLDFWQRPIPGPKIGDAAFFGDVGLPGPDGGKGGKFLILPPGYDKAVPDGYFVYRSGTNNVFVFLRSFYQDPANLAPAVAVMEGTKIYPLGGEAGAKPMQYPDASGVPANMLPIRDGSAFDQLKVLVDSEGANLADPDWHGMLAAIGIVKGEPFNPDQHARAILDRAAKTAYRTSRVIGFEEVVAGRNFRVYPDRRWVNPIADGTPSNPGGAMDLSWRRVAGGQLDLDARIWFFTDYYSISPGMISQIPGKGAKYMIAFTDSDGAPLSGGSSYRLKLPPNIPAANFWSVTLYEAENASGSPTANRSRPWAHATSRHRTPTARPISTSGQKRQTARRATGCALCRAGAISRSCGSTARPRRPSTRAGNPVTSRGSARSAGPCSSAPNHSNGVASWSSVLVSRSGA
jgi:hypothetical protein